MNPIVLSEIHETPRFGNSYLLEEPSDLLEILTQANPTTR